MSLKYDVIIIGGGLGGLLCGNILSGEGYNVCIIEQNKKLGGCIQSFVRNKTIFNTGLNYTECLGEGEVLNTYFKYLGIIDKIKIKQLDIDHFNKISFGNEGIEYPFAQGYTNFVTQLSTFFPQSRANLKNYIAELRNVAEMFPLYTFNKSADRNLSEKSLQRNTFKYLQSVDPNYTLQQILAGMNSLYGGVAAKTPLYIHALINYSFIKSSWRLIDGSSHMALAIARVIKENGGEIRLSSRVRRIEGQNNEIDAVVLESGEQLFAKQIISNIHPANTLKMLPASFIRKIYKTRIFSMENTIGMFTVYIVLKRNSFPYINHNYHHFSTQYAWTANYNPEKWPAHYFMYTPATSRSDKWADGLIVMSYMNYNEVKKWADTYIENRGHEYEEFKQQKAELLIDSIEKKFPDVRKSIHTYYTSTPLTYRDYTGTPEGSSYGILKDSNKPFSTIVTPKSRVKNLYFTGQNLNLHGILGVTIGAILTCAEFVGYEYLLNKIKPQ